MNSNHNDLSKDLLNYYKTSKSTSEYNQIVKNLIDGHYKLYLPSSNDKKIENKWKTLKKGSKLKLKSVFDVDGLKVLAAFSSEASLSMWSKSNSNFTVINSKDILDICEANGIGRIVIDSEQPTMFVIESTHNNVRTKEIKEVTTVSIRPISKEIDDAFINKLIIKASEVSSIKEIYQFEIIRNGEEILMLGFSLSIYSNDSKKACVNAVKNSITSETFHLPLELFFLEDENWVSAVKDMPTALVWSC